MGRGGGAMGVDCISRDIDQVCADFLQSEDQQLNLEPRAAQPVP